MTTASIKAVRELGWDGMVNICESLINIVRLNKPKMLIGLGQKGKWSGVGVEPSPTADGAPPVKRRDLTHLLVLTRNTVSPYLSLKESKP